MIAELFYPKELRDAIADLRAKDDLNEHALYEINRQINICILALIFLIMVLFYTDNIEWGWFCILLSPFLCFFEARRIFYSYSAVYLRGVRKVGTLWDVQHRVASNQKLIYQDIDGEICKRTPLLNQNNYKQPLPKRGFGISYYYDPKGVYKAMPNLWFVKIKHCLSKSMLNEGV